MVETEEKLETIEVVKRNGKKVEFDGTKVALAIKKGFDSILIEEDEKAEIKCQFCNKTYQFNKEELEGILERAQNK